MTSVVLRSLVAGVMLAGLVTGQQAAQKPQPARYYNPKFSPDGKRVVFESTREGKYTIYSINIDGTGLRTLTNGRQNDELPQWSADGTMITFIREVGNIHKVFVMTANDRDARQISKGPRNDVNPSFSPDGKYVAWAASTEKPEDWRDIVVAAVDGSSERTITSGPGNDTSPVWISNTRLVYGTEYPPKSDWMAMTPEDHAKRRASAELMAVDADGSHQVNLTNSAGADFGPSFAPAIGRIFFRTNRSGTDETWSMNPDGSDAKVVERGLPGGSVSVDGRMVTYAKIVGDRSGIFVREIGNATDRELIGGEKPRNINDYNPAWSPDGKWIAFESNRDLADPGYSIYVVGADGSGLRKLSAASNEEAQPAWSPDGKEIAFSSRRAGHLDVYLMNTDGSNQRRLTTTSGGGLYNSAFSPDGQWIALQGRPDNALFAERIYIVKRDGTGFKQLTPDSMSTMSPRWTIDGKWILAVQQPGVKRLWDEMQEPDMQRARSGQEIVLIKPDGSDIRVLTHNTDEECCIRLSADGRSVIYGIGEGAARKYFTVGLDGGTPRAYQARPSELVSGERSPDGRFVAVTRKTGEISGVYVVEVATGRERLVAGGK